MKARMNIRSIIITMAIIGLASMFFINISFATTTGKITVETAKLREQPNTDSKVLELTSLGEEVEILEEVDGWYKVKYKKITGYIRNDLMEVKNNIDNNTTTATEVNENTVLDNTIETNTTPVEEKNIEKGKYKISENVRLKIIPLISAIELDEIGKDAEVEVIEILNDWVKVKTTDGKEGWIRKEKLVTEQENAVETKPQETISQSQQVEQPQQISKIMYVNSETINVRQKPDKTSKVLRQLSINTQVTVLSTENGWCYVDINSQKGYIAENLLSDTKQETSRGATNTRNTSTQNILEKDTSNVNTNENAQQKTTETKQDTNTSASSGQGSSVVSYAQQFLGCKYVYGGTTTNGFDCSGFTQFVYKHFGVTLNRTAAAQYSNGTAVTSLQAGDLVMFGKSGINHVGIYIGGNTFIHAANSNRGVTTDTLASGYYKTNYVGARRIF